MKKIGLVVLFCCLIVSYVFADEYVVSSFEYYEPNYNSTRTMNIKYDDATNTYYLNRSTTLYTYWYELNSSDLYTLRKIGNKALEWEEVAKSNQVDITKDIDKISVKAYKKSSNNFYYSKVSMDIRFVFASFSNGASSAIFMLENSVPSSTNQYIDIDFEGGYILDISAFMNALSDTVIQKAIEKHNQAKKAADDLFK